MDSVLDLRSIFVSNGVGVVLLALLLYVSRTRIRRQRSEDKIYTCMIIGVMLGCITEVASYLLDGRIFPGARILNYAMNTYLYTVNLLLAFFVLLYVDLGIYDDPKRIWRHYKPQVIIAAVMFLVNLVNLFVPISFRIGPDNTYERTPVSYIYYFIILYYCLSAMLLTRRYERENGAKSFLKIPMFLIPIVVGAGLQFLFYGLSLAWLSAAIGLMGLYMMQQNESAYIDPLTGLYNRHYLDHFLSDWISRGGVFSGAMLDLDDFKRINDSFGHTEGDAAIRAAAKLMRSARGDGEFLFRFAGDEFIVLRRGGDGLAPYFARLDERIAQFHSAPGPGWKLSVSWGESRFDGGTVDDFLREMDENMYRMKSARHADETVPV